MKMYIAYKQQHVHDKRPPPPKKHTKTHTNTHTHTHTQNNTTKHNKQPYNLNTNTFTKQETIAEAYIFRIQKACLFTYIGSLYADNIVQSWFVLTVFVLIHANKASHLKFIHLGHVSTDSLYFSKIKCI